MRIAESAIQMYSERIAVERHTSSESLTVWKGDQQPITRRSGHGREMNPMRELNRLQHDPVTLSHRDHVKRRDVDLQELAPTEEQEMIADLNTKLLRAMFERLTGRRFRIIDPAKFAKETVDMQPVEDTVSVDGSGTAARESAGFGLAYDYHESHYEYEKTNFAATGTIATADGQTIDFTVGLSMSREFYSEQSMQLRAGDALKDPLVINFSGTAAQLGQRDFAFDIDADGNKDQISFVGDGSGFLALDKNNDGIINDGSELFGALSGDGFAELSEYDSDGNNWIDENDAIYQNLRVWSRNNDGVEQLVALGQAGVGAIYLGHLETMFAVKDDQNAMLGQVRESGLAVMESGQVVTMQQLDLVA